MSLSTRLLSPISQNPKPSEKPENLSLINLIASNDLNNVKQYIEHNGKLPAAAFLYACELDTIHIIKYFLQLDDDHWNINIISQDPLHFYIDFTMKTYAKTKKSVLKNIILQQGFNTSCINGHIEVAKYLYNTIGKIDYKVDYTIAELCGNKHFDILEWIIDGTNIVINDINSIFQKVCAHGDMVIAEIFLLKYPNIKIMDANAVLKIYREKNKLHMIKWLVGGADIVINNIHYVFEKVCACGDIDTAKIILLKYPNIKTMDTTTVLGVCCQDNRLYMVKWLVNDVYDIITAEMYYDGLFDASKKGNTYVVNFLYKKFNHIYEDMDFTAIYFSACLGGHYKLARWFYKHKKDNIDINGAMFENFNAGTSGSTVLFVSCCIEGHIEIAKWLLTINKDIDIHYNVDELFRRCCEEGYLDVAKWLLTIDGKVDIQADVCGAFRESYIKKQWKVVKWLKSFDSYFSRFYYVKLMIVAELKLDKIIKDLEDSN
jgi:hypothetical protein